VRLPVPGASLLHFWKTAHCRRDSIFPSLLPGSELGTFVEPSDLAARRSSRGNRVVHASFAIRPQSAGVCQPLQFFPFEQSLVAIFTADDPDDRDLVRNRILYSAKSKSGPITARRVIDRCKGAARSFVVGGDLSQPPSKSGYVG